jgi:cation diffusion facilitator family transporter
VGVLLTMAGALISFSALQNLSEVHRAPQAFAIWALLLSIAAKTTLWLVKGYYGRRIHSAALLADASNDGADVLSASVALAALGVTLLNPQRFAPADHIGGAIVGIIVILLGVRVIYETSLQLMDTMPDETMLAEIREAALAVPGALGIEKCFARKTGLRWHVDLHLEVDPEMTVQQSHDIATQVREHIREKLDWVADVLVHVEPHLMGTILSRARR